MSDNPNMTVPKGSLLKIANNILELLDYPSELENEDDLFLDDFYIAIVGNLISDRKFELQPGKDNEEKVKSLTQLINLLSEIIEMDLSHISASGIINKHDRVSAKCLLELIEELIKALINENENENENENQNDDNEETESGQGNGHKIEEIDQEESLLDSINQKQNISAGNINRKVNITDENIHNKELIDDDDMIEDLSANIQKMKENQKKKEEVKKEEIKPIEIKEKKKPEKENKTKEKKNLEDSSQNSLMLGNRSCFEALDFEKAMKEKIAYENGEDSYIRKTYTQNDISRYERDLAENEVENQLNENELNYGGDIVNYGNENDEKNLTDSHVMNVSHISGVSRSKDNSDNIKKKVSEGEIPDLLDDDERKNTSSFIKKQKEKVNENYYDDDSNVEISANMIQEPSAHSAPNNANNRLKLTTTSDGLIEASIDDLDNDNINDNIKKTNEIQASSEEKNSENNISNISKSSKKKQDTKGSSNKKNNNINEKINTNSSKNHISQSDVSKSSIKSNKKSQNGTQSSKKKTQNKNTTSENSSILEELPMDDEEFKYEIIKEFRRLYGNKLDRVFLKHNIQNSHDMLEIILRNIKLARQKMMKIENRIPDPDDLLTKEYMNRYEKELQYILDYYKKEKKKEIFSKKEHLRL